MGTPKDGALAETVSGLFPSLIFGGTVKNVSFTKAVHNGHYGFITSYARYSTYFLGGHIENVYVHLTNFDATTGRPAIFSSYSGVAVKDCIVVIDAATTGGDAYQPAIIGSRWAGEPTWENVYAVSAASGIALASYDADVGSTVWLGVYTSFADMAAANLDLSGFDTSFWTVSGGVAYPKAIEDPRTPSTEE